MADISSELQFRITQTGAKELSQSLVDVDGNMRKLGQSTQTLTQFVREQRTENRQNAFLFRESRDVIGSLTFATIALTSATGGSSKEVQKLNQVLTSGFTAFQAANFAMSALGIATGGVSTAIQAVVGIGVGLLAFLGDTSKGAQEAGKAMAKLDEEIFDLKIAAGELPKVARFSVFTSEIILAESELRRLQGTTIDWFKTLTSAFSGRGGSPIWKITGTPEEIDLQVKLIEKLRLEMKKFEVDLDLAPTTKPIQGAEMTITARRFGLIGNRENRIEDLKAELPFLKTEKEITANLAEQKKLRQEINDLEGISVQNNLNALQLANHMQSNLKSIEAGFVAIGISTDSWLGKLVGGLQTIVAIYEAVAAIQSLIGIVGFLFGGGVAPKLMPIGGGGIGAAGGSGTTININQSFSAFDGRGLKQTFNKPEVRNAITSAINDAARKGKV